MKQPKKYRTIIIEPSQIVREGIKLFLEKNSCFQVTTCFSDIQSFENKSIKEDFQVILCNPAIIRFYKPVNIRNLFADYSNVYLIAIMYQYVDAETLQNFDGILDIYDEGGKIPKKILKIIETTHHKNNQITDNIDLSDREK